MDTKICHANVKTNADTNGIGTKIYSLYTDQYCSDYKAERLVLQTYDQGVTSLSPIGGGILFYPKEWCIAQSPV